MAGGIKPAPESVGTIFIPTDRVPGNEGGPGDLNGGGFRRLR
jgi:hypothetical protein